MTAVEPSTPMSLPLSTAQTDVWYDEQLSGGGLAYAMADYVDIRGPLDIALFEAAFRGLGAEAECFRARFFEVDGEPRQVIEPLDELLLRRLDLSGEADPEAAALDWMRTDMDRPFTITDFPLFRAALITIGPRRHFWYLASHHLVGDGFSAAICHRRTGEIYSALLQGTDPSVGALPPFRHLIDADLAYHESPHRTRDKQFWGSHFDTTPDLVSLSGKEPAPARGFLRRSLDLAPDAARAVRDAATAAKVTLPTFFIAAMAAYTQRISGINDLLLTVPVAARAGVRSRATPGMVANYLPLRMRVDPTTTGRDLLAHASRELAATLKHQRYHVNQIRRDIGVRSDERRPFGGPFINVLPADDGPRLGSCETRVHNLSTGITNDLSLTVLDGADGGIEMHLNGNPDLYDGDGVAVHLDRLAAFVERLAHADPDTALARIDVVTERELTALVDLGIGPVGEIGDDVVPRVRAVARQRPDAVAVVDDAGSTTYGELVGRASALSRRLVGVVGATAETAGEESLGRVGLLGDPGADFVTGVLGVLGAGGAYVPLDPSVPETRLAGLVTDSGARLLVVTPEHRELAAAVVAAVGGDVGVVVLDGVVDPAEGLFPVCGGVDDAAYVIFTSGSTGRPKGALVHRRGLVNHLLAKIEDLALGASDTVVQNAPLTFDVSVWQMLAPLLVGASVRTVGRVGAADPDFLFGLVTSAGVSVLEVVPSLLRAALDVWDAIGAGPDLTGLRRLMVTGEAVAPDVCTRWFTRYPNIALINAYGPTECSDDVTHALLTQADCGGLRVPIGRAVRNARLYVLGDELRPVPVGAMGELYVGGIVVGRGYIGDPQRTGAVFVADPYGGPGTRMYRTGDRVLARTDGSLEFVERRDFQVKIRGHRVELGEIESVLRSLPAVQDAVVRVLTDDHGVTRLAAYLVGIEGAPQPEAGAVRSATQRLLPDYMVPSAVVVLAAMPLTEHGKTDRTALPEPDFSVGAVGRAPRDAVETILCDVLADVLAVPAVYIDDNFFALGGDSISAIQVVSRARSAGLVITPRDILESRTPAAIAAHVTLAEAATERVDDDAVLVDLPDAELAALAAGRGPVQDVLPLSPLQQGLLFHTEFDPDGVDLYTVQTVTDIEGTLDVTRLRAACAALVRRHANLRAFFRRRESGDAVALVATDPQAPWSEIDLSGESAPERDRRVEDILARDRAERFDLSRPPLVRFTLITLAPGRFRFLWTAHHICTDGWSVPVLIRELAALYADGPQAALPEAAPFRRYLAWLARQDEEQAHVAWHRLLAGFSEPTLVAPALTDVVRGLPGAVDLRLSADESAALTAWVRGHDVTLSTVVRACWAVLLGRHTGRRDVAFGSVTSGRPAELPGVETMVGMFINTVPVRADLHPARTVRELLADLGGQQAAMLPYQHLGLADVQHAVPGLAGMGELFDTAVVFENVPAYDGTADQAGALLGDDVRVLAAATRDTRHYPLSLVVEPGRELAFRFDYAPEAFTDEQVERIARQFAHLLRALTADPDARLGRLDVAAGPELRAQLAQGIGRSGAIGEDVVPRVRAVAALCPDTVAVVDDHASVTYAELVGGSSALARRLVDTAAGEAVGQVGLLGDAGADFVTGVLGVLGAGGAYMPLDPAVPVTRLVGLVADSGARILVAPPSYAGLAAELAAAVTGLEGVAVDVVVLDGVVDPAEGLFPVCGDVDDAAYVIFTSGSTGRPKGALVHRRGLVNHLLAKIEDLALGASDVVVQNAPLTFDVSVWQMLAPLLVGATVRPVSRVGAADPDFLFGLVTSAGVTVLEVVPSLLRAALDVWDTTDTGPELTGLRWLMVTGEAVAPDACARWFTQFPGVPLINAYGPTECSDDVTHALLSMDDCAGLRVPIGRAVRNARLYVLGDELRPVPTGAMGELYVGGIVVGRGYVGDPIRTGAVFVADPFGAAGTRMYRTGDRVVARADGSLEFVERRDFQVKIRGHRVELGEIEAGLAAHPAVGESVVAVHGEGGNQQLVAYLVATEPVEPAAVRQYLGELLPAYMVPSAVVVLPHFPLTAHGKIDRKALPAPDQAPPDQAAQERTGSRGPRTPVEATLCAIFADVLGVVDVGIDDDFFTLGGHSLLATALVSRVRTALQVELPVRELFTARTVARLAGRLASAGQARATFRLLDRPERPPLSPAQTRMWFLNRLERGGYTIPLAVRLSGVVDPAAMVAALGDVVARHEILRTTFPDQGGVPFQDVHAAGPRLETLSVAPAELAAALSREATRGFDLAVDLPLRARLYTVTGTVTDTEEHVLLLVLHHIAGDAWSVDVLAKDLATAYAARTRGTAPDLPPLPAQYADYAVWQHEMLGGADDPDSVVGTQTAFWREALAGMPDELALPTDLPRGAATEYRGGSVAFSVPVEVHTALVDLARRTGASVFMVVQAAVAALLSKVGAGTDVPMGSLVAGRTDEVAGDLVGFFVNTVVLRTDTSRDPEFAELVERVRDTDLAAFAHQDLPFEHLLEALRPARSLSRQPLFQVMLSYYTVPDDGFELDGLVVRHEPLVDVDAKFQFDLTFQIGERRATGGLEGFLDYSTSLFTPGAADLLARRLTTLLAAVAADPTVRLSGIDLLTADEHRMLERSSGPGVLARPAGASVDLPTVAELLPGRRDDAIAVRCGETSLTKAGLRVRVEELAARLAAAGVGPEQVVTVDLPAPVDRLVGVLAVLAAGGAYHVVDPDRTPEAAAAEIADARPALVLHGRPVELLAATADPLHGRVDGPPRPEHAASVDYLESFEEGPIGVVSSRATLADVLVGLRAGAAIQPHDRVVLPCTGATLPAALATLAIGGSLLLAESDTVCDPESLAALLVAERPTVLYGTPGMLTALSGLHLRLLAGTRVLTGGPLAGPVVDRLAAARVEVHGHHGSAGSGPYALATPAAAGEPVLALGRPVRGLRAYVLDETLRPVPPGIGGELYLAGPTLGRGYRGRPEPTAERFVADPFGAPGARMYRTGDRVRHGTDGGLRPVAVAGELVRVRGFAVRPVEVEAALLAHPSVAAALVVVRDDRLVAHVVLEGARVTAAALREHTAARVPDFAVPAVFVELDAIELTASGKIGPLPDPVEPDAPATPTEELLRAAFAETLGIDHVDLDADFFTLGGNSLLSVRLVALARQAGVPVTVADVLTHPSARRLAEHARRGDGSAVDPVDAALLDPFAPLLPIRPTGSRAPLFCVHAGLGLSLPYLGLVAHLDDDRPVYGLQSPDIATVRDLPGSVGEVAEEYVARIREVAPSGPYHLMGWSFGGLLVHEIAARLQRAGERVGVLAVLDSFPVDGAAEAVPTERELLVSFLEHIGYDGASGRDITPADVIDVLARDGSRLADIGADRMRRVLDVMNNNARLAHAHRPAHFTGRMILVHATESVMAAERVERTQRWAPFVDGPVESHDVDCGHEAMMRPEPQREIGELLAALLRAESDEEPEPQEREYQQPETDVTTLPVLPSKEPEPEEREYQQPETDIAALPSPGATGGRARVAVGGGLAAAAMSAATETLALARRRLTHLRQVPGRMLAITLNSLITMFAIGYVFKDSVIVPGGDYPEFLLPAALMQVGLASVAPTAIAVALDLKGGLTDRFRSLPIARSSVLVGHSLGDLLVGLVALAVVTGAGLLVGGGVHAGPLSVLAGLAVLVAFLYVMIWVAILLGLTLRNPESIDGIGAVATLGLSFLSNAFLSVDRLPAWLRPVAEWNPVSAVTTMVRRLWGVPTDGVGFPAEHPGVVVAVTLVVALAVATTLSFRRYRTAQ